MSMRISPQKVLRKLDHIVRMPYYILSINRIISKPSYYPDMPRKSRSEMWMDNFKWILRHQELMTFYTSYGMDVKGFRNLEDFIPTSVFWNYIRDGNRKGVDIVPGKHYGKYNYLVLLRDKYVFSAHIAGTLGDQFVPKTIALIDRGNVFIHDSKEYTKLARLCQTDRKAVFKVVDGSCGNGVFVANIRDGKIEAEGKVYTPEQMIDRLEGRRYLLQDLVIQHPALQVFSTKCVNTIRIITIQGKSGKISVFSAFLRVGTDAESFVDNRAKGGLAIGIDLESGKLMKYGLPHATYGVMVESHPISGVVFDGYQLPYWKETVDLVCAAHLQFSQLQSIGWDVAIQERGPVLIEGNDDWEIGGPQDTCGGLKKRWNQLCNQ